MPYFRVSGAPNDLTLLPLSQRDHEDLAAVAADAEADVIRHFTRTTEHPEAVVVDAGLVTQRYVWLRGYAADPGSAVGTFADAMRKAVARVIRWRIPQWAKKPNVDGASGDKKSETYRRDAEWEFPPGWDAPLRPFRILHDPAVI